MIEMRFIWTGFDGNVLALWACIRGTGMHSSTAKSMIMCLEKAARIQLCLHRSWNPLQSPPDIIQTDQHRLESGVGGCTAIRSWKMCKWERGRLITVKTRLPYLHGGEKKKQFYVISRFIVCPMQSRSLSHLKDKRDWPFGYEWAVPQICFLEGPMTHRGLVNVWLQPASPHLAAPSAQQ